MAGSHTAAVRYHRSTLVSGTTYQQSTTAGASANATTVNSYATAGTVSTIQFVPTTTQTATATVPGAPGTAAKKGWVDAVAENAANQITFDAATWTVKLRVSISNTANSQQVLFTTIIYRLSGSTATEMGRGTLSATYTSTLTTASISVPVSSALVFAAGDLVLVEVYSTTQTAGVAAAPATATTIKLTIEETSANGASTSLGTYSTQVVRSATTATSPAGAGTRLLAGGRSFSVPTSLAVATTRTTAPAAKVATSTLAGAVKRTTVRAAVAAALTIAIALQRTVGLARTTAVTAVGVGARRLAGLRSFAAAATLATVFARAIVSARSFSTAATLAVSGLVQMPLVVLNRIVGGGGPAFTTYTRSLATALTLVGASQRTAAPSPRAATLSPSSTLARSLTLARGGLAALAPGAVAARGFAVVRSTAASLTTGLTRGALATSRAFAGAVAMTGQASRAASLGRAFAGVMSPGVGLSRAVALGALRASLSLAAVASRAGALSRSMTSALSVSASVARRIALVPRSAVLSLLAWVSSALAPPQPSVNVSATSVTCRLAGPQVVASPLAVNRPLTSAVGTLTVVRSQVVPVTFARSDLHQFTHLVSAVLPHR